MGDLAEDFKAYREYKKQQKEKRENHYVPLLKKAGAKLVNYSTWLLDDYLCYSSTGRAMHKKWKVKTDINSVLKMHYKGAKINEK